MKMNGFSFTAFKNELPPTNSYSALVVDDFGPAKKLLGASLQELPQISEIEFADSGEEALEKVGSKQYDLIFLDVMMPGLDGFETCVRIRNIRGYELTPIIMVTGDTSPDNYSKWAAFSYTTYMTKPIQQEPFRKLSLGVFSWLESCKPV
jgi:CheY-like chemotaxis protein